MNNILAAQVLRSHLPEITDGAYKTAMEIAIKTLYKDAYEDWKKWYSDELSALEYLELTEEEWYYWLLGGEKVGEFKNKVEPMINPITNEIVGYAIDATLEEVCGGNYKIDNDNEQEETYVLTPKGIATLSLLQCGLVTDIDDPRIEGFWTLFENGMRNHDYIKEEEC